MTDIRVWAPAAHHVSAEIDGRAADLTAARDGWWQVSAPDIAPDARYGFRLDGGDLLSDPRSPRQPDGPARLSQRYDQSSFAWTDSGWRGRRLPGSVLYELHVGTFTAASTFDAAIERLDHLVALGVDMVELMPVATFPGHRGWGYDGIALWAVHEPYGGPDGLKRFVDACHARNLAVLLDVVYNHVGIGNRLAAFGPYFTDAHATPWGPAVNLDQPGSAEVRAFIIGNALMWLRDYHLDGLRLDAVHELIDSSRVHILEELAVATTELASQLGRQLILIAESDAGDPRLSTPRAASGSGMGGYGLTGQWNDDFHHALHAALTGERQGYYRDFGSLGALAKTLTRVFLLDGSWSTVHGTRHGRKVDIHRTPASRFVGYLQNHDQIGNRVAGDRIGASLTDGLLRVGAGLVLTAPFTPMLFMGEEWGASTPWQYFTDHPDPGLGRAVAEGRRAEFAQHGWTGEVPDPQAEATFARSRLNWAELDAEPHRSLLAWYRELIALRRRLPELTDPWLDHISVSFDEEQRWLVVNRGGVSGRAIRIAANLSPRGHRLATGMAGGSLVAASAPGITIEDSTVWLPPASLAVIVSETTS